MRTTVTTANSMSEAGVSLLSRALSPESWRSQWHGALPKENTFTVGRIEVCARVDVLPTLDTVLRISFRGPRLSPMGASDLLDQFIGTRFLFVPNAEWFVEIDARRWIHFSRRYTQTILQA